ncbi:hypothetical protein Tco_1218438 [Tanacetum coccineum]
MDLEVVSDKDKWVDEGFDEDDGRICGFREKNEDFFFVDKFLCLLCDQALSSLDILLPSSDLLMLFPLQMLPNYPGLIRLFEIFFLPPRIFHPPKDTEDSIESPIPVLSSFSVGSYTPLGSEPVLEEPDESDTCYNVYLWK